MSQHKQSKGGPVDEPKEERVFGWLAVALLLFSLSSSTQSYVW
jgi:hypothetical protein